LLEEAAEEQRAEWEEEEVGQRKIPLLHQVRLHE